MKINYSMQAYFLNAAFFSIVPHGNQLTRLSFEILLTINIFGPQSVDSGYKLMYDNWRQRRDGLIRSGFEYLYTNNYLMKQGAKYYLTDRAMLLIAQVERRLKAMVEKHTGANPVGRPVK